MIVRRLTLDACPLGASRLNQPFTSSLDWFERNRQLRVDNHPTSCVGGSDRSGVIALLRPRAACRIRQVNEYGLSACTLEGRTEVRPELN